MTEYFAGPSGEPIGPDVDALPEDKRNSIRACLAFFADSAEQLRHFAGKAKELGRSGADTVITLIDVDDPTGHGRLLADLLMPGCDWQQYRDQGQIPVARGLATKEGFPAILTELGYNAAANALTETDALQVLVLHAGTVQVLDVQFPEEL